MRTRRQQQFLLRLLTVASFIFGLGTLLSNGPATFAPQAVRDGMGDIPYWLFPFDAGMGILYMVAAYGFGTGRPWGIRLVWVIAVLHSFSATAVWLGPLLGTPVSGTTLTLVLLRECYWVLVGLFLYKSGAGDRKAGAAGG